MRYILLSLFAIIHFYACHQKQGGDLKPIEQENITLQEFSPTPDTTIIDSRFTFAEAIEG